MAQIYSRHKRRNNCLEEKCDRACCAGEKASNSAAEGEEAKEQRADSEEEGDEHEREHEPCQVVEHVSTVEEVSMCSNTMLLEYFTLGKQLVRPSSFQNYSAGQMDMPR